MKKIVLVLLTLMMVLPAFAQGGQEATTAKDSVTLVVTGNPYRFYALSSKGCGGDDNLVLANVYDSFLLLKQTDPSHQHLQRDTPFQKTDLPTPSTSERASSSRTDPR